MRIAARLRVHGFASDAVEKDIPSLLEEFRTRGVFREARASWDAVERSIRIEVMVDGRRAADAREMIRDEVFDAVIASIRVLDSIELDIERCEAVDGA